MRKVYLLFALISISAFAQKKFDNIKSEKLGEERRITIGLPESYEANPEKISRFIFIRWRLFI